MNLAFSYISSKNRSHPMIWLSFSILLLIVIATILSRFPFNDKQSLHLVVYAFSTLREVLSQGIFPAFEQDWESKTGDDLVIEGVFGPSGTLSLQITQGSLADIAIFSNQMHIDWLKYSKVVNKDTNQVMIAATPLVIITRPENPLGISDFADLTRPGIQLLHGDPTSSGVGEWAVLAEYGSTYLETGETGIAEIQLNDIWQNVQLLGTSARAALAIFELGAGNALITYEHEAYYAQEHGIPLEIIMPERTILARHYAVVIDKNVSSVERPVVEAFQAYILSDEGQQILSQYYFRSTSIESDFLPALVHPFTEQDLGGWSQAYDQIIENYWKTNIEPKLELVPLAAFRETSE